ncbi:hypothetical protein K457DRAFT_802006 [Linnemannia elongata AG-77]|uniref:Ion transport domain-containing protein n=1 Tax=Linnemannia elongata AG-77 TaxID=1314771 RepID=A0A197JI32_9FUNG|nr:hypothetical protein K457DRAFT_802006 [Linnemannia elongata AG-77]
MVMIAYFFFAVILMLNVLIALLNVAFNNVDTSWHQVWLRNRMRVVESAENMSYQIPGFRRTHNWFPQEIYYTATHEQAEAYKKRWASDGEGESKDVMRDRGAQAISLPGGKPAMDFPMPRPVTPSSKATHSPTLISSETSTVRDSAALPATRPAVAHVTVGELDTMLKKHDASVRSQFEELESQMQLQKDSPKYQTRLLIEQLARLHSATSAQS